MWLGLKWLTCRKLKIWLWWSHAHSTKEGRLWLGLIWVAKNRPIYRRHWIWNKWLLFEYRFPDWHRLNFFRVIIFKLGFNYLNSFLENFEISTYSFLSIVDHSKYIIYALLVVIDNFFSFLFDQSFWIIPVLSSVASSRL